MLYVLYFYVLFITIIEFILELCIEEVNKLEKQKEDFFLTKRALIFAVDNFMDNYMCNLYKSIHIIIYKTLIYIAPLIHNYNTLGTIIICFRTFMCVFTTQRIYYKLKILNINVNLMVHRNIW